MMDLGLGGFIEKFESYFGKWPTFALMLLVGLALASTCLNLIFVYTIKPIYELISRAIETQKFDFSFFADLGLNFSILILVATLGASIYNVLINISIGRSIDTKSKLARAQEHHLEMAIDKLISILKATKDKKLKAEIIGILSEISDRTDPIL